MVLLRSLILSASVAALAAFSRAAPTPTSAVSPAVSADPTPTVSAEPTPPTSDPTPTPSPGNPPTHIDACGVLGSTNATEVTYNHVVDCYNAIPFDNVQAATTLSTMHTLYKDYYVFTDFALTPKAPKPFADDPVDILGELEKIGRKKYTSDYKFHNDILTAVNGLRDGHAAYNINCYQAYSFVQNLTLYAPVVDGEQSVRVYLDKGKRGYEDCTVNTINGEDALTYVRSYARDVIGVSHDPNARLNFLLASQNFDATSGVFIDSAGSFAERTTIPETEFVDYQLECPTSSEPIDLHEPWSVVPQTAATFNDAASFVANVCLDTPEAAPPAEHPLRRRFDPIPRIVKRADADPAPATPGAQFPGAEQILAGNATIFYQLKDTPQTGVLVCHTFSAENTEFDVIAQGLKAFHDRNVTNIIVDFQGNTGGSVELSAFLVQALFPNKQPLDTAFPSDIRVTKSLQELTSLGYNKTQSGLYNAHIFINLANGTEVYQNNDLYEKPITLTRNGRHNLWTEKTTLNFPPVSAEFTNGFLTYSWTNKADNIRIITDGRCGSACGMASYFWTTLHGVAAYAIGGTNGEDLSMFSFAGASVLKLTDIQNLYKASSLTSPMADLPYKSDVTFSWLEMYGKDRETPFEYDAELYRPKYRLDYTPVNARSREALWKEVTAAAWK